MNVKADDSDAWSYIESIARPISSKTPLVHTFAKEEDPVSGSGSRIKKICVIDEKDVRETFSSKSSRGCDREFSTLHATGKYDEQLPETKTQGMAPIYRENCGLISCIDKNTKARIDRGLYPIDKLLDLHGYSQDTACGVLLNFITSSFLSGHRCVLVITGWGSKNSGKNSIKSSFHKWLQSTRISNMLLYYTQAIPPHGGKGAFYVLLRNKHKLT